MFFSKLPSKSQCLKVLRKVYPGAEIHAFNGGGLQLTYIAAGERRPVLEVNPKGTVGKDTLTFAVVKAAFHQLGFQTSFKPGIPGKFVFDPIKEFKGPETQLPVELDPDEPAPIESGRVSYENVTSTPPRSDSASSTTMLITDPNTGNSTK